MKTSGIYKIINKIDGKYYIGSSHDILGKTGRFNRHIKDLMNKKHHSIFLQRAWDKYGRENFEFIIIENIENKIDLLSKEQYYLNLAEKEKDRCYNMRFNASGGNLRKESIEKMSSSIKMKHKLDPNYTSKCIRNCNSLEARKKRSETAKKFRMNNPEVFKNAAIGHKEYFSNLENLKNHAEASKDKHIYEFFNTKTNEKFIGFMYDFRIKYNLKKGSLSNLIHGRNKSYKFWILVK